MAGMREVIGPGQRKQNGRRTDLGHREDTNAERDTRQGGRPYDYRITENKQSLMQVL
jgi:hypothetical protein